MHSTACFRSTPDCSMLTTATLTTKMIPVETATDDWAFAEKKRYLFDAVSMRFRDAQTGRFISDRELFFLRDEIAQQIGIDLGEIGEQWTPKNRQRSNLQIIDALTSAISVAYVLGSGGLAAMNPLDWLDLASVVAEAIDRVRTSGFFDNRAAAMTAKQRANIAKQFSGSVVQAHSQARARFMGIALPAHPGDGSTPCRGNCRCQWRIRSERDERGGWSWSAYWIDVDDGRTCDVCDRRSRQWNPYKTGVNAPPPMGGGSGEEESPYRLFPGYQSVRHIIPVEDLFIDRFKPPTNDDYWRRYWQANAAFLHRNRIDEDGRVIAVRMPESMDIVSNNRAREIAKRDISISMTNQILFNPDSLESVLRSNDVMFSNDVWVQRAFADILHPSLMTEALEREMMSVGRDFLESAGLMRTMTRFADYDAMHRYAFEGDGSYSGMQMGLYNGFLDLIINGSSPEAMSHVNRMIAERNPNALDLFREAVAENMSHQMKYWSESSISTGSMMYQRIVADMFGLSDDTMYWTNMTHARAGEAKYSYDRALEMLENEYMNATTREKARLIYENTQEWLKMHGIESLTMHRGIGVPRAIRESDEIAKWIYGGQSQSQQMTVRLQPISSFSSNYDDAWSFANSAEDTIIITDPATGIPEQWDVTMILTADIPAERVFSSSRTGQGALIESEFTVIGGDHQFTATLFAQKAFTEPIGGGLAPENWSLLKDARDSWEFGTSSNRHLRSDEEASIANRLLENSNVRLPDADPSMGVEAWVEAHGYSLVPFPIDSPDVDWAMFRQERVNNADMHDALGAFTYDEFIDWWNGATRFQRQVIQEKMEILRSQPGGASWFSKDVRDQVMQSQLNELSKTYLSGREGDRQVMQLIIDQYTSYEPRWDSPYTKDYEHPDLLKTLTNAPLQNSVFRLLIGTSDSYQKLNILRWWQDDNAIMAIRDSLADGLFDDEVTSYLAATLLAAFKKPKEMNNLRRRHAEMIMNARKAYNDIEQMLSEQTGLEISLWNH